MTSFSRSLFPPLKEPGVISLLQSWPVFVAEMVQPVEGADAGIGIAALEDDNQLFCVIDPYIGMAIDDLIAIFWNGVKVHELKVKLEDLDKRLFFFLSIPGIVSGLATCHYQLTRAGETVPDDPSAQLTLLVKLEPPGLKDKEPHFPWHSELKMPGLPQDVIDNGVTKPWLVTGVPMTIAPYPAIAAGDIIRVKWGSVLLLPHKVTPAEADGSKPIVVTATSADILSGGDSASLNIQYEIHDRVWNFCEKWSKDTSVVVDAGAARLDPAIFKEAVDGQIALIDLNQQPVTLQILIKSNDEFDPGDTLKITVIGTPAPGSPSKTLTAEATVGTPPYILEKLIPYDFVKLFARGTLDASYTLHKQDGSDPLSSKRTFAAVIGDLSQLPAPTINELIGSILPFDILVATVVISYSTIANGDVINLIWTGTKSDGTTYLHEEEYTVSNDDQKAGSVTIYVPGEHVLALKGGSLKLFYRVSNDTPGQSGVSQSEFLLVEVGTVQGTLPAPEVEEAKNGIIDPTLVHTQAHVLVKPVNWVAGDKLTYHWIGYTLFGSTFGSVPITMATVGKPVRFRVDAQFVSANIGYFVTVIYTLWHAATGKYSYSLPTEVLVGIPLGLLPAPKVVQAPNGILNPMHALPNGVDIECRYASMDETLDTLGLKWRGTPGGGTSEDLELPAEASGTVKFHLPPSFVGANIHRSVDVNYDVKRYGLWTPSEILQLVIQNFQDPDKDLPRPEVPQAQNGELHVMELAGDARILVKPWPFIIVGQLVWLYVEGVTSAGPYRIDVLTAHKVDSTQVTQGLNQPLLKTELLKLLHASRITVTCKVIFDNSTDEAAAIVFPTLPLTIRQHYEYVTPVITRVKNAQNVVIPEAGQTYDKRLTIEGTATRAEKVDVQINGVSRGTPPVDANSAWTITVDLLEGLQRVVAIALYDATDKDSDPRTFTIKMAKNPSITRVADSIGSVGHNGVTYDNSVTVTVNADPNQSVQLYNGAAPIGAPITLDGNGNGTTSLSNLVQTTYSIKARANYGSQLESPVHVFRVAAHLPVNLTSVRHSGGELGHGGTTKDTAVYVSGTVTPFYSVQLFLNNAHMQTLPSNAYGQWSSNPLAIPLGPNTAYARAVATGQQSGARSFTRVVPLAPLIFNTNPVTLSGKTYILPAYPNVLPAFNPSNSVHHPATGGQPGYRYASSNPGVAQVDGTGLVTARGRGTATITAFDAANQSKSYTVTVTGVIHCIGLGSGVWATANSHAAANGARLPSLAELQEIFVAFGGRWPMGNHHYWSTDASNFWWPWAKARTCQNLVTGARWAIKIPFDYSLIVALR
ncbi:Ig-like domain repeat protein [Pseudomonas frederiksbergensis]|uniref:Ig-like domain-containing protein n=1 Tax=Pseudomonas frederiksbergensis TaxID=104087 RepID=UPI001980077A|nr:Ig-like domain-containing protein [Pseudomonas frederiksbergensis]MBN3865723.1 Ig-like domain repeat protein [Pseudomonas frederiksbergensis]